MLAFSSIIREIARSTVRILTALALVVVLPSLALALDHTGAISTSETWFAADSPHVVTGNVTVNAGVTLTIEAGAEVRGAASRNISVRGNLIAIGTVGAPIAFVRDGASNWGGLYVQGAGSATLAYCGVEYSGYGVYLNTTGTVTVTNSTFHHHSYGIRVESGAVSLGSVSISSCSNYGYYGSGVAPQLLDGSCVFAGNDFGFFVSDVAGLSLTTPMTVSDNAVVGVWIRDCENATVDNLVLSGNNGSQGPLYFVDCGEVTVGGGCDIAGNAWPVAVSIGSYLAAASIVPTSGNASDAIHVRSSSTDRSCVWRLFAGLPYVVDTSVSIEAGGALLIEPGVTVRVAGSVSLGIHGTLTAVGSPDHEIVFTRAGASNWNGLLFQAAGTAELVRCIVEHSANGINVDITGTIDISESVLRSNTVGLSALAGTARLTHCRIVDNLHTGIRVAGGDLVLGSDESQWNDIHDNGAAPGRDLVNDVPADLTAQYVYWGTTDWTVINDMIHDGYDDADLGLVHYVPFLSEGHGDIFTATPPVIASRLALAPSVPNPFNPTTVIGFELPAPGPARLQIFDVRGALVRTLVDGHLAAGQHAMHWDGRDDAGRLAPSAVYFSRLEARDHAAICQRMTLAR